MLKWSLIQALNQLKLLLFYDSETVSNLDILSQNGSMNHLVGLKEKVSF